jgi:ketosteroid isomerase-like protein
MSDPRAVAASLIKGIEKGAWTELSVLYDENVLVEHPFNRPAPTRIEGLADLVAHLEAAPPQNVDLVPHDVVIRETDDPEVVVLQYDYTITSRTTGKSMETPNILVIRVRDGRITHSVDYHNHAAMHEFFAAG